MHAFRLFAALVTTVLIALPVSFQAQAQTGGQWNEYYEVFEDGARHANVWQWGWTGIYGTSLAVNAYQSSEASDDDDRFDARVGVVKSALALGGMFLGERPGWTAYAGLALILCGLAAVDGRLLQLAPKLFRPGPQ